MSSELHNKLAKPNQFIHTFFESEQGIANGTDVFDAEIVFEHLENKYFV